MRQSKEFSYKMQLLGTSISRTLSYLKWLLPLPVSQTEHALLVMSSDGAVTSTLDVNRYPSAQKLITRCQDFLKEIQDL